MGVQEVRFEFRDDELRRIHADAGHSQKSRGLNARGVVGHKVRLMGGDVRLWHGIRISSPERA